MTCQPVRPFAGCHCRECEATRRTIHARLTTPQRGALAVLDATIPRHPRDLASRDGVRPQTLDVLALHAAHRPPLIRRIELRSWPINAEYVPFYLLTQHGADVLAAIRRPERKVA